jgi:predicted ArsR family transcriptional regulator
MKTETATRVRRTDEQLISDLEAEIQRLKHRATQRQVTRSPAIRYTTSALNAIDSASGATDDAALRRALEEARATLVACLAVQGVVVAAAAGKVRRGTHDKAQLAEALLAHIRTHSGQRGEQIAAALGTDTKTMRPVMHALIAENKVKTRGERRGMQYFAA